MTAGRWPARARWLLGLWIGLLAAGLLAGLAVEGNGFDGSEVRAVAAERSVAATAAARLITQLGGPALDVIFAVAVVGLLLRGQRSAAGFILLAAGGGMVLSNAIKFVLARPRPPGGGLVSVSSFSWPSGHAASSSALYGALALLLARRAPPGGRIAIWGGLVVLVGLIGASRVYLGVHYPTDVAAGWAVGGLWLLGVRRIVGDD